jgi:hypothetical protein
VKLKRSQVLLRDLDRDDVLRTSTQTAPTSRRRRRMRKRARRRPCAATPIRARGRGEGRRAPSGPRPGPPPSRPATSTALSTRPSATSRTCWRRAGRNISPRWRTPPATAVTTTVARRALLAQRRRFAGSPRAADAAFFLGRLDENGGRGHAPALAWYERYLDEAPRGSYVAEALGRKMIAVEQLHGAAAARNVAEQYVRSFPRGSYAGAAQALLGAR